MLTLEEALAWVVDRERADRDWSVSEFARRMSLDMRNVRRDLRGGARGGGKPVGPAVRTFRRLKDYAKALGMRPSELLRLAEDAQNAGLEAAQ